MIKVALKHFIYEKCIDVAFDSIINNFALSTDKEFNIGDGFYAIKISVPYGRYVTIYDCTILDNIEGTILVEHYARMESYKGEYDYEDYETAVGWRINIDEIKGYDRRP